MESETIPVTFCTLIKFIDLSYTLNGCFICALFYNYMHWSFGNIGSPSYTDLTNVDNI